MSKDTEGEESLLECIEKYGGPIKKQIFSIIRDSHSAEELYQETCLRAWRALQKGTRVDNMTSWLFRIAVNLAYNYLERDSGRRVLETDISPGGIEDDDSNISFFDTAAENPYPGPEETLIEMEKIRDLQRCLGGLPSKKQDVMKTLIDRDCSLIEAAEELKLPVGTVKSRYHYAVKELRIMMNSDEDTN